MQRDPFAFLDAPAKKAKPAPEPAPSVDPRAAGCTQVRVVILGQCASKSNRRIPRAVKNAEGQQRVIFIKNAEALEFERNAAAQIPPAARAMLEGPLRVTIDVFYQSDRSDLDVEIVYDVLQAKFDTVGGRRVMSRRGVYLNDRQVKAKLAYHHIDVKNPRVEVLVETLQPQQLPLGEVTT